MPFDAQDGDPRIPIDGSTRSVSARLWRSCDAWFRQNAPAEYEATLRLLAGLGWDRQRALSEILPCIEALASAADLRPAVQGRVKTTYSIWRKLRRSTRSIHELQDLVAARIIVGEVVECYRTLERMRAGWMEIPGSLDDYIDRPKANGYQSLHVSLVSGTGHAFELQIRTRAMHQVCEVGSAAHWRYASERPGVIR